MLALGLAHALLAAASSGQSRPILELNLPYRTVIGQGAYFWMWNDHQQLLVRGDLAGNAEPFFCPADSLFYGTDSTGTPVFGRNRPTMFWNGSPVSLELHPAAGEAPAVAIGQGSHKWYLGASDFRANLFFLRDTDRAIVMGKTSGSDIEIVSAKGVQKVIVPRYADGAAVSALRFSNLSGKVGCWISEAQFLLLAEHRDINRLDTFGFGKLKQIGPGDAYMNADLVSIDLRNGKAVYLGSVTLADRLSIYRSSGEPADTWANRSRIATVGNDILLLDSSSAACRVLRIKLAASLSK